MTNTSRSEAYWTERNLLVDTVRAARTGAPSDLAEFSLWCRSESGAPYCAALDALKAFDASHGGAPIL